MNADNWFDIVKDLYRINNFMSVLQAQFLFETACNLPDYSTILEIGAYHGLSTCALGYGCKGTHKHVFTIDTFHGNPYWTDDQDGESYLDTFQNNVKAQGLTAYITPIVGYAEDYYDEWNKPLQMLFIDGDHRRMFLDLDAFYPFLQDDGILVMHDVEASMQWQLPIPTEILFRNMAWGIKRSEYAGVIAR